MLSHPNAWNMTSPSQIPVLVLWEPAVFPRINGKPVHQPRNLIGIKFNWCWMPIIFIFALGDVDGERWIWTPCKAEIPFKTGHVLCWNRISLGLIVIPPLFHYSL